MVGPSHGRERSASWSARLVCCALAALLFAVVIPHGAYAQTNTTATVDLTQGFARIVFDLPDRPRASAEIAYGVLVVKTDTALSLDTDRLQTDLAPYVSMVRQDADKRTLRFALRGPLKLNQTIVGRQLAIDLIPPRYKDEPPRFVGLAPKGDAKGAPGGTSALVLAPSEARERREIPSFAVLKPMEELPIAIGVEATFTRIVFEWRQPVEYTLEMRDDQVVVRFSEPARVDLSALNVDPPRYVQSARSELAEGKLSLIVKVEPGLDMRGFRDGNKIVVDLVPKAPEAMGGPLVSDPQADDGAALAARNAPKPPSGSDAAAVLAGPSPTRAAPPTAAAAAHAEDSESPAEPSATAHDETSPPTTAFAAPAAPGHVAIVSDGARATLTVRWVDPTPAAVFRRGDVLWMVFETALPMSVDPVDRPAMALLGAVEEASEDGAQILRVELKSDALVEATPTEEGRVWSVRVADAIESPPSPIAVIREVPASGGPRLRFRAEAQRVHWLSDPAAGDFVLVATALAPPRGVVTERQFVELDALVTAQGVAAVPFTEDVVAVLEQGDVVVGAKEGLAITASETIERGSTRSPVERVPRPGYLDFAQWRGGGVGAYTKTRQAMEQAIVTADKRKRDLERLALARYYVANGFGAEALGLLGLMIKDDPRIENAAAYHALRGAALLTMDRNAEAETEFGHASLANEPEIRAFRAAAAAKRGRYAEAADGFAIAEADFGLFPADWQARLRLLAAETALARKDLVSAERYLQGLTPEGLDGERRTQAAYLAGTLLEAQGRHDDALQRLAEALQGPRGPARVRATLTDTRLRVAAGLMGEEQGISALERLRYDWRGDGLELETLETLGDLYIADRRYRQGLAIMRAAVSKYPTMAATSAIETAMRDTFKALFLEGAADGLAPVDALALYYDYRELTPVGRDGDDMIRRLAERLIVVDLLPQAAELLQHQVDNRLQGAAKSQVATRLAVVYLMDHKAEQALRAIRSSRQAQLPDWLQAQRRLLEARALTELKQFDFALEVLMQDDSAEAQSIRADIYWGAENWPLAAESIEAVLGDRWRKADEPLTADDRFQVLRAALAYHFAKDAFGLEQLNARYGAAMKETPDAASFALLTEKLEGASTDLRDVARKIASIDTLDSFMASFRARYDGVKTEPADAPPT